MIKKISLFSLFFILSFVFCLLTFLPAKVVWEHLLVDQVPTKRMGINVLAVDGTIWDGRAHIKYRNIENIISWDILFAGVFTGELPLVLDVDSHIGELNAELSASPSTINLVLEKAELDLAPLNPLLRRQRVTLDGQVQIKNLTATIEDKKIVSLDGNGSWSGGNIAYPVGRRSHDRSMPPFFATVSTKEGGNIEAGIKDSEAQFNVIDVNIDPAGEMLLQVKRRLLDLADEPARHKDEQDVVFKMKKNIYASL